jgi:HSP20 family protein
LAHNNPSDWVDKSFQALYHPSWSAAGFCLEPLVEVENKDNTIVVTVDLPCIEKKEDIKLHVSEETFEITAEFKKAVKWERWGFTQKQLEFNSFKKTIRLPERVNPRTTEASFKRGVLRVILPKKRKKFNIKVE